MPKASSKSPKRHPRPSDPIALAKLIGDIATGQAKDSALDTLAPTQDEIRRVMSALGKMGGKKGGKARAAILSPKKRAEIASKAAQARWKPKRVK